MPKPMKTKNAVELNNTTKPAELSLCSYLLEATTPPIPSVLFFSDKPIHSSKPVI